MRQPSGSGGRRSDQGTKHLEWPHPGPLTPPAAVQHTPSPGPSPQDSYNPTVVRRPTHPSPAAAAPLQPAAPPPARVDGGETEYFPAPKTKKGPVVGVLVAIDGELEGEIYAVPDGNSKLGRGAGCTIELLSKRISREHAEIRHAQGMFAIMPLSDKNPTYINDRQTDGEELSDGDTLRLGQTTFKFRKI